MDVACPNCQAENRIEMPAGETAMMVKCFKCGADFQAQASASFVKTRDLPTNAPSHAPQPSAPAPPQPQQFVQPVPVEPLPVQPVPVEPVFLPVKVQPVQAQMAPYNAPSIMAQPVALQPAGRTVLPMVAASLPNTPVQVTCTACQRVVVTSVKHEMGLGSWIVCAGLCCFGVGVACPCAGLLPCCMTQCQDAYHRCPSCGNHLGVNKFIC